MLLFRFFSSSSSISLSKHVKERLLDPNYPGNIFPAAFGDYAVIKPWGFGYPPALWSKAPSIDLWVTIYGLLG